MNKHLKELIKYLTSKFEGKITSCEIEKKGGKHPKIFITTMFGEKISFAVAGTPGDINAKHDVVRNLRRACPALFA